MARERNEPSDWHGPTVAELELRIKHLEMANDDKENRLRKLEKGYYLALGIVLAAQIILKFIKLPQLSP